MKKTILCLLTILVILFLFGTAAAGPEAVSIIPISKWNYKNVDGWGFYAKNGEYSWFAFILRNPSDSEFTVTLPVDVDVAHNTRHKIVNTAYKVMINGSTDHLYEGYYKEYFTGSFTLPKDSTYSVFFDVTDMQPYNQQWDTDVFFSIRISDKKTTRDLPITGVLAYDAKNTTPEKLTIVVPGKDPLTTTAFCRNYDASSKKISFSYSLKNNTAEIIPLELATSLAAEGMSGAFPVSYTGCTSGGSSCSARISGGIFKLDPGETAEFSGEASLTANPAKSDFFIRTSLRYDYNGGKQIPFLIGAASGTCSENPAPAPSEGTPSVITVTPAADEDEGGLVNVRFCRSYDRSAKKVSLTYTLKNSSSAVIPLELAQSIAVEGQKDVASIRYTGCTVGGSDCSARISGGIFKLNPGETVDFHGEAKLSANPAKANFYIRTSLRYDFGDRTLIPFLIGYASDACTASGTTPAVINVTPSPTDEAGLVNVSFCRDYNAANRKVTFRYALRNKSSETIPVELAQSLAVEGIRTTVPVRYTNCVSGGRSCASRISGGSFKLQAGETAEFSGQATLPSQPANPYFYIKTSLRYNYKGRTLIPFLVGYTTNACSAAHTVSVDELLPKAAETAGSFSLRLINDRDEDMTVLPGVLRFGDTVITDYEGIAAISAVDVDITGHSDFAFAIDESFILPPYSAAEITLSFKAGIPAEEDLTWNYSIDGTANTVTLNEETAAKALAVQPALYQEITETEDTGLQLFPIETARIPDRLPATGFSARSASALSLQPETLAYRSLNGLRLDIPAIGASAEIVQVPLTAGGDWAVEWLNDRAGILAGTPLPGEGISVIAAHNHLNDSENGPFIGLALLAENDRLFIGDNSGRMQTFSVYANSLLEPEDGSRIYETARPGSLVLLTCESELEEGGYAFRRAVFAELLGNH